MRKLGAIVIGASIGALFLFGFTQSSYSADNRETAEKAGAPDNSDRTRVEYEKKARARLENIKQRINELEAQARASGAKTKREITNELDKLKVKRSDLEGDMRELRTKSRENWEIAKQKTDAAITDLEERFNKIRSRFEMEKAKNAN